MEMIPGKTVSRFRRDDVASVILQENKVID